MATDGQRTCSQQGRGELYLAHMGNSNQYLFEPAQNGTDQNLGNGTVLLGNGTDQFQDFCCGPGVNVQGVLN